MIHILICPRVNCFIHFNATVSVKKNSKNPNQMTMEWPESESRRNENKIENLLRWEYKEKVLPVLSFDFWGLLATRSLERIKSGISINHAEKSHNHPDDYNMSQYILCGISWDDWTWENLESIASATHSKYNNESNTQVIQTISEYYIRIENRFLFWSIAKKTSEKTPIYVCFTVSGSFLILKTQFF